MIAATFFCNVVFIALAHIVTTAQNAVDADDKLAGEFINTVCQLSEEHGACLKKNYEAVIALCRENGFDQNKIKLCFAVPTNSIGWYFLCDNINSLKHLRQLYN